MSNFVHHNFAAFKSEFETAFGENICHWIFNNIDINIQMIATTIKINTDIDRNIRINKYVDPTAIMRAFV